MDWLKNRIHENSRASNDNKESRQNSVGNRKYKNLWTTFQTKRAYEGKMGTYLWCQIINFLLKTRKYLWLFCQLCLQFGNFWSTNVLNESIECYYILWHGKQTQQEGWLGPTREEEKAHSQWVDGLNLDISREQLALLWENECLFLSNRVY